MQNCFCCGHCLLITNPVQTNLSNLTLPWRSKQKHRVFVVVVPPTKKSSLGNLSHAISTKKSEKSPTHARTHSVFPPPSRFYDFLLLLYANADGGGGGDRITPHWSFRFDANGRKGRERRRRSTHSEVGIVSSLEMAPEKDLSYACEKGIKIRFPTRASPFPVCERKK